MYASLVLLALGAGPAPSPPAELLARMRADGTGVREVAAYGRGARAALPKLRLWAVGGSSAAAEALLRIAPDDPGLAREYLALAMKEAHWGPRRPALEALLRCGPGLAPLLPEVIKQYKADGLRTRAPLYALEAMGPAAAPALPLLVADLEKLRRQPRADVVRAIGAIGPKAASAVPALLKELRYAGEFARGEDRASAAAAGEALARIGRAALPAILKELQGNPPTPAMYGVGRPKYGDALADALLAVPGLKPSDLKGAYFATGLEERTKAGMAELIGRLGEAGVPLLAEVVREGAGGKEGLTGPHRVALFYITRRGAKAAPAVPALRELLRADNARSRQAALEALAAIGPGAVAAREEVEKALRAGAPEALDALGALGAAARPSAPALATVAAGKDKNLKGEQDKARAAVALSRVEPKAARAFLPVLLRAASDTSGERRQTQAVEAIGRLGELDEKALLALADCLASLRHDSAGNAVLAVFSKQGKPLGAVAPKMLAVLRDDRMRRPFAVVALGMALGHAPGQLPKVRELLNGPRYQPFVSWTLKALWHAGPAARPLKDDVLKFTTHRELAARAWAHHALEEMKLGPELLPVWGRALADKGEFIRQDALREIARAGKAAEKLVGQVEENLKAASPRERALAARAIKAIAPARWSALLTAARRALRDPKAAKRDEAARLLQALGPAAAAEADLLVSLIDDGNAQVRLAAMRALAGLGAVPARALPALLRRAKPGHAFSGGEERVAALVAIGAMGPAAKPAVPFLIEVVREDATRMLNGQEVRQAATRALGNLGAAARPALPALRRFLSEENAQKARGTIFSNTFLGEPLPEAIRKIEEAGK